MGLPQWEAYREALEELYRLKGREVMGGLPPEQYQYGVGYLRALETALTLAETLTTVMTRVQTDANRRNAVSTDTGRPADRIFVNSPHWSASRADRVARS